MKYRRMFFSIIIVSLVSLISSNVSAQSYLKYFEKEIEESDFEPFIGGEGQGPGEIRMAHLISIDPDNNVVIYDGLNKRSVFIIITVNFCIQYRLVQLSGDFAYTQTEIL